MTITFGCVKFSVKNRYVTAYVEDIYEIIDIQSQEENCMILLVVDTQKGIMDNRLYEFERGMMTLRFFRNLNLLKAKRCLIKP